MRKLPSSHSHIPAKAGARSSLHPSQSPNPATRAQTLKNFPQRSCPHLREAALIAGLCLLYFALNRFLGDGRDTAAIENAEKLIAFESTLGIFREATWNLWVTKAGGWIVVAFNWAYILTFIAVILITALAFYVTDRDRYFRYRNVVVVSFFLALVTYAIFPVAPPRILEEFGFVDTMKSFGPTWYHMRDGVPFFNAFAAIPSLHFAWAVAFGWLFFRQGGRVLKVLAFAYPTITLVAIVVTANHYFLDAAAGAALMAIAYGVDAAARRWKSLLSSWFAGFNERAAIASPPRGEAPARLRRSSLP